VTTPVQNQHTIAPECAALIESASKWLQSIAPGAKLTSDSRRVDPGDVFFAYAPAMMGLAMSTTALVDSKTFDARAFIPDAIERGARAVMFDDRGYDLAPEYKIPYFACPDLQSIAGLIANAHYAKPDDAMFSVAVTGTNGKTTCTQWLGAALSRCGIPTAVIGTFGIGLFKEGRAPAFNETGYTTPDAVQLQEALMGLHQRGAAALAIEASSIGLQQQRLRGLHVDVALFTNLTRDHLDYHGDIAAYEAAKTALFSWPGLQHAVLNLDDPMGQRLLMQLRDTMPDTSVTGYGLHPDTFTAVLAAESAPQLHASEFGNVHKNTETRYLIASDIVHSQAGTQFQLQIISAPTNAKVTVKTQLIGDFNVSNVLGVIGVLLAKGFNFTTAVNAIEALEPVAGRMQQIGGLNQPLVVIDYAHTPDALEKTLVSLRKLAQERRGALWCVFGCGGGRDAGKRPQMGAISQQADHVIVTSDNPRHETPAAIIADIVAGFGRGDTPQVIEDRASAILWALRHATKNDVVLLAGKGHESYQEIKGRKYQFLDADHAAIALAARATMKGPD
jgi:UDP-N-acetylmuramoyl-L-alanyl-D-glutamate--2,6-diaminopimelate ligase